MITKFKIFESDSKYNVEEIEHELRKKFDSEEQFETWCIKVDSKYNFDDVDLGNVAAYDVPNLLKLPTYDNALTSIIIDILTKISFDDYFEPRDGDFQNWKAKKTAKKYNI